jgi:hypothetical protein
MNGTTLDNPVSPPGTQSAAPERVSLRNLYASAMREVMSDPRKAIAEHDPGLATLLPLVAPVAGQR